MGRALKRVPLGFQWPLRKCWEGYINPYQPKECSDCEGTGYNPGTKQIADEFYSFDDRSRAWHDRITQDEVQALVDEGRLMTFTHTFSQEDGWRRREDGYIPSAEEVNQWEREPGLLGGHDAINQWILTKARAKRLAIFGDCSTCKGEGDLFLSDEHRKLYEEWQEYDPPTGEGYQLWETTSEGSPISPVFASAEELAGWCAKNATVFASERISSNEWLEMFLSE